MAFVHGKESTFSVDNAADSLTDISAYVSNLNFGRSAEVAEVSAFGDDSKAYISGLKDGQITMDVSWDATVDALLEGILGGDAGDFSYSPDGGTTTYTGDCILIAYTPASAVNDAVKGSATFQITGDVSR